MGAGAGRTCGRRHRRCGRRCGRPGIGRRSRNAASADRRSSPCPRLPTARRVRRCSSVQYSTRQLRNRRTPMAHLDGSSLTLAQLVAVADGRDEAALAAAVLQRIDGARTVVEQHAQGDEPVYGVNTGFGALAETRIAKDALDQLQVNLLRSHAAGVGEPLPVRAVRATMALRANVLAKGFSGIRRRTVEHLLGLLNAGVHPIEARIHDARPYDGQRQSAANVRRLLEGSAINKSHEKCGRVQDAYSLRCAAQVHGAARDALGFIEHLLTTEANAATDNPMVFAGDDEIVSGGNFHGAPVAIAADLTALAVVQFATISERRADRLVNPVLSELPAFLTPNSGLQSGYMLAQVTAAALASEVKTLAHPAGVDTIPTSANREDHVSMSMGAALKAQRALELGTRVIAIEILLACQAIDLLAPLTTSPALQRVHARVRSSVPR